MCTPKKSARLPLHERDGLLLLLAGLWVGFGAGDGVRMDYKRALLPLADMGNHPTCTERSGGRLGTPPADARSEAAGLALTNGGPQAQDNENEETNNKMLIAPELKI